MVIAPIDFFWRMKWVTGGALWFLFSTVAPGKVTFELGTDGWGGDSQAKGVKWRGGGENKSKGFVVNLRKWDRNFEFYLRTIGSLILKSFKSPCSPLTPHLTPPWSDFHFKSISPADGWRMVGREARVKAGRQLGAQHRSPATRWWWPKLRCWP